MLAYATEHMSMPPVACIVHQVRGRIRLRVREKRSDVDYFQAARAQLESLDGVQQVTVNNSTASIVVYHEFRDNDVLQAQLSDAGLFTLSTAGEPMPATFVPLRSGLSHIEQAIKSGTSGSVDLRTLAFLGLMGLTLHQILRGQILGPALPMLWNAFSLVGNNGNAGPEEHHDPAADATADSP